MPHVGLRIVDLCSGAATMNNVKASSARFHNYSTPHDHFHVHFESVANNGIATETQMEWSASPNHMFNDTLELMLLVGYLKTLLDPTEQ
jgi:hypothetical protein